MITILSILIVLNQLVNYYFYGKGNLKVSYPLTMISMLGYMVVETMLAFNDPSQRAIFLFNLVNLFGFVNAYKGYKRLKGE